MQYKENGCVCKQHRNAIQAQMPSLTLGHDLSKHYFGDGEHVQHHARIWELVTMVACEVHIRVRKTMRHIVIHKGRKVMGINMTRK